MISLQPVQRARVSEAVTQQILELISSGKLKPGDKLPSEAELMQQTGVGRPSLRSALHTLESMNIIEIRQGVGAFVCEVEIPIISIGIEVPKLLSQRTIVEAIAIRRMLEPEIAAAAAEVATEEDLCQLRDALSVLEESKVDDHYPECAHIAFHLRVAEVTHNALLTEIARFLLSLWQEGLDRVFDLSSVGRGDATKLACDHQILYDAIAARDPVLARQRMLDHISVTESRVSLLQELQRLRSAPEDDQV